MKKVVLGAIEIRPIDEIMRHPFSIIANNSTIELKLPDLLLDNDENVQKYLKTNIL